MNTPNHDIDDQDLFVNTFFNSDGSVKKTNSGMDKQPQTTNKTKSPTISAFNTTTEKLNLAKASSLTEGVVAYQPFSRPGKKKKNATTTIIAITTAGVVCLSIAGYAVHTIVERIKNTLTYSDVISSISYVKENMDHFGHNPNDQYKPYYDFDTNKIIASLESDTRFTPDDEIFATHLDSKGLYNAETKVMDPVVRMETDGEIKTFDEYLKSKGYSEDNIEQWEKDMKKSIYDNIDEYKEKLGTEEEGIEVSNHGRR